MLAMNPAGCISVCMARSVRSYVASVALKLASPAGTTSTCFGRYFATDITTRQSRNFRPRLMPGRKDSSPNFKTNNKQDYGKGI